MPPRKPSKVPALSGAQALALKRNLPTWSVKVAPDTRPGEQCIVFRDVLKGREVHVWLANQDDAIVISELRVNSPETPTRTIPPGGIGAEIRRLPISKLRSRAIEIVRNHTTASDLIPGITIPIPEEYARLARAARQPAARRRKERIDDAYLLLVARAYVEQVKIGGPIIKPLAHQLSVSPDTVKGLIQRCRRDDFLTKTERGIPGGELTPKARHLLQAGDV